VQDSLNNNMISKPVATHAIQMASGKTARQFSVQVWIQAAAPIVEHAWVISSRTASSRNAPAAADTGTCRVETSVYFGAEPAQTPARSSIAAFTCNHCVIAGAHVDLGAIQAVGSTCCT
jgi:hypothetical protein